MKKTILFLVAVFSAGLSFSQTFNKVFFPDTNSVKNLKYLEPDLIKLNQCRSARLDNYSPDYFNWEEGSNILQHFISNQSVNLWDGNYIRPMSLHKLIQEHIYRIVINIKYPWMDSGIELQAGKSYYLVSSGLASTSNSKLALWIGPEGKEYEYNTMPMYSVIGKLGLNSNSFYIGKDLEISPNKTERLFIGYNDDSFLDNIGYYIIDVFELKKSETIEKLERNKVSIGNYYAE
jgi:hypothetical protein